MRGSVPLPCDRVSDREGVVAGFFVGFQNNNTRFWGEAPLLLFYICIVLFRRAKVLDLKGKKRFSTYMGRVTSIHKTGLAPTWDGLLPYIKRV
jgi:hypothetical protein